MLASCSTKSRGNNYLRGASWAASSQGMQDDFGAKSANWLCGCVCGIFDFVFNYFLSFTKLKEFQSRRDDP